LARSVLFETRASRTRAVASSGLGGGWRVVVTRRREAGRGLGRPGRLAICCAPGGPPPAWMVGGFTPSRPAFGRSVGCKSPTPTPRRPPGRSRPDPAKKTLASAPEFEHGDVLVPPRPAL